jgi:hypothetical protein
MGRVLIFEDGKGEQFIDIITPEGKIFKLVKSSKVVVNLLVLYFHQMVQYYSLIFNIMD